MLCLKVVEPVNSSSATEKRECKSCQQVCSYNYAPAPKLALNKSLFHINCIGCWVIYLLIKTYKSDVFLLAGLLILSCTGASCSSSSSFQLYCPYLFMARAPNIEGCWILSWVPSSFVIQTNDIFWVRISLMNIWFLAPS